ncbi:glycosyltransferase family 2 protein [Niabella yanshanensis]|uniref:Glycosyltransferase family 2 protein n=1 Tax=Niabella yanshanensis TaxID=577386 RepID=A0ABZ0W7C4_9BACT|nr:glycosyltransferase family 2 protein [Niabella yanshanensis]WQD39096.1 glycosyltransferase family 2 protein [Niabella yanshanensis]
MLNISIICPLYNKKGYIQETIDSVINQTYTNWEMIIVDDGSTDGSYELVKDLYQDELRVRLYCRTTFKQNKGGSVCRNIGISLAKGEYIMFLDADDLLTQNCLLNRVKAIRKDLVSNLFVFNEAYFIKNPGQPFIKSVRYNIHKCMFLLSVDKVNFFLKRFLKNDLPWTISNTFWQRDFLGSLNGFDEHLQRLQDPEMHIRMLLSPQIKLRCFKYSTSPDILIRLDINRHISIFDNRYTKANTLLQSIQKLMQEITGLLKNHNKENLIKYLDGYIFTAQADFQYILQDMDDIITPEVKKIETEIIEIAKSFGIPPKGLMNKWTRFHNCALRSRLLKKIKVPALIYVLFMLKGFYPRRKY